MMNKKNKFNNKKQKFSKKEEEDLDLVDADENFDDDLYQREVGEEESVNSDDQEQLDKVEEEMFQDQIDDEEDEKNAKNKRGSSKMVDVAHMNVDMGEVNLRIGAICDILADLKNKKEEDKTRDDYMKELKHLLMVYYDYNEDIMTLIMYLFPPNEAVEFLESNNTQRVMTIRSNTIKTKRRELAKALIQRGVNLDPLAEWSKVGLKIYDSQVPVGATPEYLAGHYMLQSGSSFLPVMALNPQENEKILDMAAAPGGKTTYIAQMMKNTGVLVANDLKKERLKGLFYNIHRLGIRNTIITNYDGRKITKAFNSFDRVLLDAPCSGLGVISKDPSIKLNRHYKDIIETTRIQKELLLAAIDATNYKSKTGGIIVYSTCSISVEENEWVVDYALRNRYVKLVPTELVIGEDGFTSYRDKRFHPSLKTTKRIYPHLHNMDGFFVAKLKKYADGSKLKKDENKIEKKAKKVKVGRGKKPVEEVVEDEVNEDEINDEVNKEGEDLIIENDVEEEVIEDEPEEEVVITTKKQKTKSNKTNSKKSQPEKKKKDKFLNKKRTNK